MDTSDPDISFNDQGVCNHCTKFMIRLSERGYVRGESELLWKQYLEVIKASGKGKPYDCVVGISGGVDSCYVAYLCKEFGLRALLIHLDNGWDTEIAVNNIKSVVKTLGFDYVSYVIDWEEFREIQLAFLKSSSVDLEMTTDIAILASIYDTAAKHNIRYIISGGNLASEGILPIRWGYHSYKDMKMYKAIVRKYSNVPLRKVPTIGLLKESYYRFFLKMKTLYILDYVDFDKDVAKSFLSNNVGWKDYGGKHHESKITAFWQGFVMYDKFNMDYRRSTFASQICKGQISRQDALEQLKGTPFDPEKISEDKKYVAKKFRIGSDELDSYLALPPKTYVDFPNNKRVLDLCYDAYRKYFNQKRV